MRSELTSAENWLECELGVHFAPPPLEGVLQVGAHTRLAGDDGQQRGMQYFFEKLKIQDLFCF